MKYKMKTHPRWADALAWVTHAGANALSILGLAAAHLARACQRGMVRLDAKTGELEEMLV